MAKIYRNSDDHHDFEVVPYCSLTERNLSEDLDAIGVYHQNFWRHDNLIARRDLSRAREDNRLNANAVLEHLTVKHRFRIELQEQVVKYCTPRQRPSLGVMSRCRWRRAGRAARDHFRVMPKAPPDWLNSWM